jgi:hypothetical protein
MGGGYGINVRGIPRGNQEWSIPRQKKMLDIIKNKEGLSFFFIKGYKLATFKVEIARYKSIYNFIHNICQVF